MAKKFSELPAADSLTGTEIIAIVQGGVSKKSTVDEVAAMAPPGGITIADWSFPAGAFPASANVLYIATADHGTIGDPDYVPAGTWFIATSTPSGYADFNYK
jgi:hypothetical protein